MQLLQEKAVEKGVIIEQKLSTSLHTRVDKGAGVVMMTSKDLGEVQALLEICERWGLTAVLDKLVVFSEGPWTVKNMIIVWEQYYEVNGYSPMAR